MKNAEMFKNYMTLLGEMFDKKISDVLKTAYWQVLEPYSDEEVEVAFKRLVTTSRFFPKPAEILEAIQGPQQDQSVLAWQKLDRAVKEQGPYRSVKFDDPVIHSVIELMGGWVYLGNVETEEWKWKQKEFERLYRIMQRRGNHPEYLPGIAEIENVAGGFQKHIPDPVLIGEGETQKLKLLKGGA